MRVRERWRGNENSDKPQNREEGGIERMRCVSSDSGGKSRGGMGNSETDRLGTEAQLIKLRERIRKALWHKIAIKRKHRGAP